MDQQVIVALRGHVNDPESNALLKTGAEMLFRQAMLMGLEGIRAVAGRCTPWTHTDTILVSGIGAIHAARRIGDDNYGPSRDCSKSLMGLLQYRWFKPGVGCLKLETYGGGIVYLSLTAA